MGKAVEKRALYASLAPALLLAPFSAATSRGSSDTGTDHHGRESVRLIAALTVQH